MDSSTLESVAHYCESTAFRSKIEAFRTTHLALFGTPPVASSSSSIKERDHRSYEVFLVYQELLDDLLTRFASLKGIDSSAFLSSLRDAAENNFTPLFEEHAYKWLADLLLSWTDFESFCSSMEEQAQEDRRK